MTTAELTYLVRKHWEPPAFSVLTEVRNGTGYSKSEGYADVLAMSVWPSRGLELIGGEMKVSRSDWIKEKKDPAKADKFIHYCNRWYLITGPGVVNSEDEIPATWGWLTAGPKGLKTMKAAPQLLPQPFDVSFVASIFRNAARATGQAGMVPESKVRELAAAMSEAGLKAMNDRAEAAEARTRKANEELHALQSAVRKFNFASGTDLSEWKPSDDGFESCARLFNEFRNQSSQKQIVNHYQILLAGIEATKLQIQSAMKETKETPLIRRNAEGTLLEDRSTCGNCNLHRSQCQCHHLD